jgi:hypothetical protein
MDWLGNTSSRPQMTVDLSSSRALYNLPASSPSTPPISQLGCARQRFDLLRWVEESEISDSSMAKATWNGKVVAESDTYETVEGNVYFPDTSVRREYFRPSSTISTCPWKGQAR